MVKDGQICYNYTVIDFSSDDSITNLFASGDTLPAVITSQIETLD